jgi:glycosyltransferase involved in cell wall biosynthesis
MKILAVAPWVPSTRRPRSLGLLTALAKEHQVRLVCAVWDAEDVEDVDHIEGVEVVPVPLRRRPAQLRALRSLATRTSIQQAYLDDQKLRRAIEVNFNEFAPDMTYFNVIRSAHLHKLAPSSNSIIDLDEFRSDYYQQLATRSKNPFWRAIAILERSRLSRAEQDAAQSFSRVLVSSPRDLGKASNVALVRSPHALSSVVYRGVTSQPRTLLFVGRLSYEANIEGLDWFIRKVLPEVVRENPDVVLKIVGAGSTNRIRRHESPNVHVVGRVEDVTVHYAEATVSIVPIFLATGVQMKLIESLAVGTPTVTTPLVAEQAGIGHNVHCLVATSPVEWVKSINLLLSEASTRARLSDAGRVWATANYSNEKIRNSLYTGLGLPPGDVASA